ncbi:DNA polymerase domain-containing protein [Haloplanus salinarum]|uniref:DNA polymerase domain-containing protein n=1 Tax=Haloplanus salinarum TaxID=1912324 RepID=UPI00214CC157|nr:DNA polymerase domain-containing protein [Haloplanus salinarum]
MEQAELTGSWGADDADRPEAEAMAVAGDVSQSVTEVVDAADLKFPDPEGAVDLAVTQVDYTVEGQGADEYPVVHVFGRTPDGDAEHVRVLGFEPYFYAPTASLDDDDLDRDVITRTETGYESIRGEDLTKICTRTPRDVGAIRDEFDHYEADILFPNRLLIDKDIGSGVRVPVRRLESGAIQVPHDELEPVDVPTDLRVNTFDIEVDDRSGFPEDGEEAIVCLTSHDSRRDEYVAWLYEAPVGSGVAPAALDDYDGLEDDVTAEIRAFESEAAMLDAFLGYIEETNPDVLTGWNFEDFDAPYLIDRLETLGKRPDVDHDLNPDRLSRIGEVWRSDWGGPTIKGRAVFDLLYAYKRTQFTELESYRLDAVGEMELGAGKERYPGDIGDLWEDDPERLLEYNLRDVELCVELDRKRDIISFWDEVRTFVGCKLEDAPTPGDAVDVYVLHKVHGDFALPSKGRADAEDYEGGAVFDPITGIKENVSVLDLKCFSADTDVLTPDGERNIAELEVGDPIYTLNPDTFECEVNPVEETHQYENRFGELHHLSGNTHDLKVTENHRFLYSKERGWDDQRPSDFTFDEYREIPENERFAFPQHEPMDGRSPETFDLIDEVEGGQVVVYTDDDLRSFRATLPEDVTTSMELVHGSSSTMGIQKAVGKYLIPVETYRTHRSLVDRHADEVFLKYGKQHCETPLSFEMDDWLALVGWFVTEGSVDHAGGRITIHQEGRTEREAIRDLLDRLGIDHNVDERGINVSNRYLLEWFADNCGEGYTDKQLPEWVFDLDGELLSRLLDTMIRGDGRYTDSGLAKFWTKSDELKAGIVDVAVRCGHKPTVSKQADGTWYVSAGKRGSFKKATNATVEDHDGDVYCVTAADNHVVLAGRNGNYQWVGQSLYPMCMVTINASPETKVDPEDYDDDTYHAPNGTHFRKEPDGVIREMVDELLEEREQKKAERNDHDPDSQAYEQYDRQQQAVKVIMNCFTSDTDVLTPDGVRNIRDLEVGDEVYSLDPETLRMEVKPVTETHAYPNYRGDLVDIETSKIDFSVTPNHRMLVRKDDTNGESWEDFRFVEAGDLNESSHYELPHGWEGPDGGRLETVDLTELLDGDYEVWANNDVHGHTLAAEVGHYPDKMEKQGSDGTGYVFSATEFEEHREYLNECCSEFYVHAERGRKWIPRFYDGDDFLELLAWYVTEGSVYTSEDKQFGEQFRGSATTIKLAQEAVADGGEGDGHTAIGELLDRLSFDYYVDDRSYQVTSRLLGRWLEDTCGKNSFEKRIPEFVFEASREQKERFLDTLIAGDGDRQVNSWRYTTSSERLRDDVLRLCAHVGLTASYNRDSGSWRIYCTEDAKNSFRMHRSGGQSTADDGAYCVTVADNNTLLAGRNGRFQFVGQSLYGVLGWDRFRLYDREMGAAVTATGRDVIEHTQSAANDVGYEVAYGDTDSVMLELGEDVESEDVPDEVREAHPEMSESELRQVAGAIETGYELEESINDSYDEFALEELNAHEHRFQIEFEKLYRRFFQAGKKKRYAGHIVWKEGKHVDDIDITGFEYKRSDIAPITKEVQRRVIEMIVTGEDVDDVEEYVHDVIEDFEAGNVDLDDVGIPGGIGKRLTAYDTDTAQVRGAKYANHLLGTNFQRGSKPKRLYLKKVHPEFFRRLEADEGFDPQTDPLYGEFKRDPDVICFEYADQIPDAFEVDWDKMLEKTLKGPIARVIEALGLSWDEVKSGQRQTGLGQF